MQVNSKCFMEKGQMHIYIKSKKPIGLKKEYIGSTAQKKANKITKFLINAFL